MKDTIYRQDAIDAVNAYLGLSAVSRTVQNMTSIQEILEKLPSAQPEIITCRDCKYSDENWRRVSVKWLPCMDMRTGSNWFCGSAERRTDENNNSI